LVRPEPLLPPESPAGRCPVPSSLLLCPPLRQPVQPQSILSAIYSWPVSRSSSLHPHSFTRLSHFAFRLPCHHHQRNLAHQKLRSQLPVRDRLAVKLDHSGFSRQRRLGTRQQHHRSLLPLWRNDIGV